MARAVARELELAWDRRVVANREQVERHRRVQEAPDFYAPVTARFVHDPRRQGDVVLDALLELARPGETWLDIGAGAGRYALPLATRVERVIAVEPSPGMGAALRDGMARHEITNVEVIESRWPMPADGRPPRADIALIAHVGYDVEPIGPFLDAVEAAARQRCVAILREPWPASLANDLWPLIHGVERAPLPGCTDLVALLQARGTAPHIRRFHEPPRRFEDEDALVAQLRHQLWIGERGADNDRLVEAVRTLAVHDADGVGLPAAPAWIGLVDWQPRYDPPPEGD